jgi:hypothetical protein
MNITVHLQLDNMPDDADLEVVESVIRRQLNEWLEFDRHPDDLEPTCKPTA